MIGYYSSEVISETWKEVRISCHRKESLTHSYQEEMTTTKWTCDELGGVVLPERVGDSSASAIVASQGSVWDSDFTGEDRNPVSCEMNSEFLSNDKGT